MLRVAEQYAGSDTGRQRRANEDSLLARSPLFVVADGMGGAQAGEVASRIAVESFQPGLAETSHPELELAELARAANARIHELSHANAEQAGMGTTLTAVYVGEQEVAIAHVGDSRAYCLRDGQLLRLTDDHSLVDELMRQGRLTPEEAVEHPQRSVITRALGPEGMVEVDTRSFRARDGDVYLLCSDGLTTMIGEDEIAATLLAHERLRDAGEALIAAANHAGGRDNITVVLLRLEEVQPATAPPPEEGATMVGVPAVAVPPQQPDGVTGTHPSLGATALSSPAPASTRRRLPRVAPATSSRPRRRLRIRHAGALAFTLVVLGLLAAGAYLALQSVYFIGTNNRGLVTMFEGLPYRLPGNLDLYSSSYVSGVDASTLSPEKRHTLLNHSLRSEGDAAALVHSLELEQLE
ncbi:MAG TPA: Stp1/IreP family PP2C-type Ser/Thr phosphatase [Solirubrobacteraceae bacterium]|jgi:serine/threonine protein phosphatase PrpC|nr:Stp1/IreP family PP2C-type Ser/Thr phosphatase [Solirubrobacteraceae bacterium]